MDIETQMRVLKELWLQKLPRAKDAKAEFQKVADTAMGYLTSSREILFKLHQGEDGRIIFTDNASPKPTMLVDLNKLAEGRDIFGSMLYHRNPHRQVTPRKLFMPGQEMYASTDPHPQAQQMAQVYYQQVAQQVQMGRNADACRASLMYDYLNFTPNSLDLKGESRRVVDDALIKGMGLWEHRVKTLEGTQKQGPSGQLPPMRMAGSFWVSVDDYFVDPDPKRRERTKWRAMRRVAPVWEIEEKFGLEPGSIKRESRDYDKLDAGELEINGMDGRLTAGSNDQVVYYEFYSKQGMGSLLKGDVKTGDHGSELEDLDIFGPNVYLACCRSVPYPLNLPPEIWGDLNTMGQRVQWQVPFWYGDGWPLTECTFHEVSDKLWPQSHFEPSMGILTFLNWAASFLASKVAISSRDFLVCDESLSKEMQNALVNGKDYEFIKLKLNGKDINSMVQFLQHPTMNEDIMKVVMFLRHEWELATGLTEIMFGLDTTQARSATESNLKDAKAQLRPDDMASRLEDAAKEVAKREALMARWALDPHIDIAPILGQVGAMWWEQLVSAEDPSAIINELDYRIEAGSIRKPNRAKDQQDANDAMQSMFQPFYMWAQFTGQVGPVNALIGLWCKVRDTDPTPFMLQAPAMPQMAQQAQQQQDDSQHKNADRMQRHEEMKSSERQAKSKAKATNGKK